MKRVLWLVLAAGVVVWGSVLLDLGKPAGRPSEGARPAGAALGEEGPRAAAEETAAPPRSADNVPLAAAEPAAQLAARRKGAASAVVAAKPGQGTVAVIGKSIAPARSAARGQGAAYDDEPSAVAAEPTGELGEGVLSPEFVEAEQRYSTEPRDGAWAPEEEQRVRALLRDNPLEKSVVMVHCQETTCRLVFETDSPDVWKQLLGVPGLREETALGASSPYSLRSGQLAVYFHRQQPATAPTPP